MDSIEGEVREDLLRDYISRKSIEDSSNLTVSPLEPIVKVETEEYLNHKGFRKYDLTIAEDRLAAQLEQQLEFRSKIINYSMIPIISMPIWLMAILSLPVIEKTPYSEEMQKIFAAMLGTGILGLYYIVFNDLFPSGNKKKSGDSIDGNN
jgi:hypothetical protein